jgi:hypothetical protein
VLLDEAEGNAQIGIDEIVVDEDGSSAFGRSQVAMLPMCSGIVAYDPVGLRNVWAENLIQLRWGGAAVQAGCDQNRNSVAIDAGLVEAGEDGR